MALPSKQIEMKARNVLCSDKQNAMMQSIQMLNAVRLVYVGLDSAGHSYRHRYKELLRVIKNG